MLHVIRARCAARDLHTIAPGPLDRACWRQFAAQCGDCKKSRIASLNTMMMMTMMMMMMMMMMMIVIIIKVTDRHM